MIWESGGDSNADNGVCKGLFQFNPGTWSGTPFGGQSIWSRTRPDKRRPPGCGHREEKGSGPAANPRQNRILREISRSFYVRARRYICLFSSVLQSVLRSGRTPMGVNTSRRVSFAVTTAAPAKTFRWYNVRGPWTSTFQQISKKNGSRSGRKSAPSRRPTRRNLRMPTALARVMSWRCFPTLRHPPYGPRQELHHGRCHRPFPRPVTVVSPFIPWDTTLGLNTENVATKTGIHPAELTKINTANINRQLHRLGSIHRLESRAGHLRTEYYRWTQYFFREIFRAWPGLQKRGRSTGALLPDRARQRTGGQGGCERCSTGGTNQPHPVVLQDYRLRRAAAQGF